MVQYKAETGETAIVNHGKQKLIKLETVVYSYDKDVHELTLPICTKDNPLFFSSITELMYLMVVVIDGVETKIQGNATHDDSKNIFVKIPEQLHGYNGRVTMSLYAKLSTGQQLDISRYTFNMVTSEIDTDLEELEAFYYKRFEEVLEEFRIKLDEIIDNINIEIDIEIDKINAKIALIQKEVDDFKISVDGQLDSIQTHVDEVEAQINATLALLSSKVTLLEGRVNVLEGNVDTLTGQITALQTKVTALQTAVTALETKTTALQTQANALQVQLDKIQADINALLVNYYTKTEVDSKLALKADVSKAQMTKITSDTGNVIATIGSGEALLPYIVTKGLGFYTLRASSASTDTPSIGQTFSVIVQCINNNGSGNVTLISDGGRVFTRSFYGGAWYSGATWEETADVSKAQMNKITADNGGRIATINSGSILETIKANVGIKSYVSVNTATDHPSGQYGFRFISHMNDGSYGYVIGMSDDGKTWYRNVSNGNWITGWRMITDQTNTQMQQITLNDGERKATFNNADTLLADSMALGAGVHNVALTGGAIAGLGAVGAMRGLFIRNVSAFGNYLIADDGGNVFARGVSNNQWGGDWRKYTSTQDIMDLINGGFISQNYSKDFNGKITGSNTANPNRARYYASPTLGTPTTTMTEFQQNAYDFLKALDGNRYSNLNTVAGNVMQVVLDWDLVSMVEKDYPSYFVTLGATTQALKVAVLRKDIATMVPRAFAYGNGDGGLKLTGQLWNGTSSMWAGSVTNTTDQYNEMKFTIAPSNNSVYINDDGKVYMLLFANPTGNGVNSQFYLDYADFSYTLRSRVPVGQKVPITMDDGRSKLTISSDLQNSFLSLGAGVHSVICMPAVMNGLTAQAVRGILTLNTATYGSFTGSDDSGRVFYINMNAGVLSSWRVITQPNTTGLITLGTGMQAYSGQTPRYKTITNNDGTQTVYLSGIIQKTGGTAQFTDGEQVNPLGTLPTTLGIVRNRIVTATGDGTALQSIRLGILADGRLHVVNRGTTGYISLEGISFISE